MILYVLLCGYPPFTGKNNQEIFTSIQTGRFCFPNEDWDQVSAAAKNLIQLMLMKNPKERITTEEALSHAWITGNLNSGGTVHETVLSDSLSRLRGFDAKIKM